jgi:hypothetical protein
VKQVVPPVVNTAPLPPVIKGADMATEASVSEPVSTLVPFTIRAVDPEGDNLYYVIDWDNDGSINERLPNTGTVVSGTPRSTDHIWSTAGSYTFSVRAIDDSGLVSPWVSHTILITDPVVPPPAPPVLSLLLDRYLVRAGETVQAKITITANYQIDCSVYGVAGSPQTFSHLGGVAPQEYTYATNQLFATQVVKSICTPVVPGYTLTSETRSARAQVVPEFEER